MSEFKASGFRDEFGNAGPDLVGITTMTSPYYFVPPSGSTAERPSSPPPGMLRFNTDSGRLEVWRNDHWATITGETSAPLGTRHLSGGSGSPADGNSIEYITLSTTGNAIDFGDLHRAQRHCAGLGDATRGLFGGGYKTPDGGTARIDFVTFATLGDASDFGDRASGSGWSWCGVNDATRGLWVGGTPGTIDGLIDFVTIQSTGNTTSFGTNNVNNRDSAGFASRTRAVFGGNHNTNTNIDYVTIQSTGNSIDFGTLVASTGTYYSRSTASNSVRGVFGPHGYDSPALDYQYFTIASTGNSQDFGDISFSTYAQSHGSSGKTRGVTCAGGPAGLDIEFITIATTANAQDFGDLATAKTTAGACTNANGGL